jgi:hypothetical protein
MVMLITKLLVVVAFIALAAAFSAVAPAVFGAVAPARVLAVPSTHDCLTCFWWKTPAGRARHWRAVRPQPGLVRNPAVKR